MKKQFIFIILVFVIYSYSSGQNYSLNLNAVNTKNLQGYDLNNKHLDIPKGSYLLIQHILYKEQKKFIKIEWNNQAGLYNYSDLKNIYFNPSSPEQFWKTKALKSDVYLNIATEGLQLNFRRELESDALSCLSFYQTQEYVFNDSYLEDYLYSLVYKIYPGQLMDGRPGIVNVKIIKSAIPNASTYSNGTIIINTGLLSVLDSEDELIAILTHEISHFVLDHSVQSFNSEVKRQKAAEFWTGISAGLGAIVDIGVSQSDKSYPIGLMALSMISMTENLFETINYRLGLKFTREQEVQADECSIGLLKMVNIDTCVFASALNKLKIYYIENGILWSLQKTTPTLH
jgi:hypothetical protein